MSLTNRTPAMVPAGLGHPALRCERRYGYPNSDSTAGRGQWVDFEARRVDHITIWHDANGNPQHMLYFDDNTRLRLVSDYGARNGLNAPYTHVKRMKDL